jgi:hypothetical protein
MINKHSSYLPCEEVIQLIGLAIDRDNETTSDEIIACIERAYGPVNYTVRNIVRKAYIFNCCLSQYIKE